MNSKFSNKQKGKYTDQQRIGFLSKQTFTRWVGYDHKDGGHTIWPVFSGDNFRAEIDRAMDSYNKSK